MLKPDIEKYRQHVDHLDLTEDEQIELIHTIWHVMEAFVDQAFGLHPAQQLPGADIRKIVLEHADLVESETQPNQQDQKLTNKDTEAL